MRGSWLSEMERKSYFDIRHIATDETGTQSGIQVILYQIEDAFSPALFTSELR